MNNNDFMPTLIDLQQKVMSKKEKKKAKRKQEKQSPQKQSQSQPISIFNHIPGKKCPPKLTMKITSYGDFEHTYILCSLCASEEEQIEARKAINKLRQ
jgi:hypothetical protein